MTQATTASLGAKIREVGVHSAIYGIGSIAQSAVQFLLIPVLTAEMSPGEYGAYSLILMASVVAGAIFYLGMTSALPRSYFDYSDPEERRRVFTTAFVLLLAGAAVQVLMAWTASGTISRLLFRTDAYAEAVGWAFFASALAFVNQFLFAYLRFKRHSVASVFLSVAALLGSLVLTIWMLRSGSDEITAPFRAIALTQVGVAGLFLAMYGRQAFTVSLAPAEVPILLRYGGLTVLSSIAAMLLDWGDRVFIERMLSLEHVGIYSIGYRLGSTVNALMILPFSQIWSPMMLEYRRHGNISEFFSRVVSYYSLAGSAVLITTCFFLRDLLPFVARGSDYGLAVPIILTIMAGYLVYGLTNILAAGLIYQRKIFTLAAVYYVVAAVKLALMPVVISTFGIDGAAVLSLLAYAAVPLMIYSVARRYHAIAFEYWRLWRIAAGLGWALFFGLAVDAQLQPALIWKVVVFLFTCTIFLVACLDPRERLAVRSLVRRDVARSDR